MWLLKPRSHQQQFLSNIVECYKSNDSFDNVERCFYIVAVSAVPAFGAAVGMTILTHTNFTKLRDIIKLESWGPLYKQILW